MILECKGTCAPVAPLFKGQGSGAPVMHPQAGGQGRCPRRPCPQLIFLQASVQRTR